MRGRKTGSGRVAVWLVAGMIGAMAVAQAAEEIVTMRDGREIRGDVTETHNGKVLRIDTPDRVLTLSAAHVQSRRPAPADFDLAGYRILGQPVIELDPNRRMNGRVSPGHAWNLTVQDHGRRARAAINDEKLGNITVDYAMVKITPQVAHYQGINYDEYFFRPITDFSDADLWAILEGQVQKHAGNDKPKGFVEMAHFLRSVNRQAQALKAIEMAERDAGSNRSAEMAEERKRIEAMPDTARLEKIRRSLDRRMPESGLVFAKQIQKPDALSSADREFLTAFIGETEKRVAIRDQWRQFARELADLTGGAQSRPMPSAQGEWLGLPLVEPILTWPMVDPRSIDTGWAERCSWLSTMLCAAQTDIIEAEWASAIRNEPTPVRQAQMLWLAAWYAGHIVPADFAGSEVTTVLQAAEWIARWAAAPKDAKRDPRREAARLGAIGATTFQRLVAASHLQPVPPNEGPFVGQWGRSAYREFVAPTPARNVSIKYLVRLPADYHPGLTYPTIVIWHGLNSTAEEALGWFDEAAYSRGFILASAEFVIGDREYRGNAVQHYALSSVIEDVSRRFRVDPDRVFMFGGSLGAHGAWGAAMQHFDRLAGLGTVIGAPVGIARTIGPIHAQQLPVYAIGGETDRVVPDVLRMASSTMQEMGADFFYAEYKGRGHVAFPEEYPLALDWMLRRRRNPAPAKVDSIVVRAEESWRYWIDLDQFRGRGYEHNNIAGLRVGDLPRVTASWTGNKLTIDASDDVTRVTVYFDRRLVDFGTEIIVEANGRDGFKGTVRPSLEAALEACEKKGDRGVFFEHSRTIRVQRRR